MDRRQFITTTSLLTASALAGWRPAAASDNPFQPSPTHGWRLSGQLASRNMDSSEQLYLGGPLNVRAYSSGQGAASQGNLASLELRQSLPFQTMVAAFYDIGNVQMQKFNTQHINYNSYILQGYGLSLVWYGPYGFNVKGVWAHRSGTLNSNVASYLNQNGGLSQNRFWINAALPF